MVAEHLDHLHYINDILCLKITDLNQVLTDHLLHKLLIPLYIYSLTSRKRMSVIDSLNQTLNKVTLTPRSSQNNSPKLHELSNGKVSTVVALFLLSQVFLILSHSPLVQTLAWIILKTDRSVFDKGIDKLLEHYEKEKAKKCREEENGAQPISSDISSRDSSNSKEGLGEGQANMNITDEEKQRLATSPTEGTSTTTDHPFLETVYDALDCTENDYASLFALSLLYALSNNSGK